MTCRSIRKPGSDLSNLDALNQVQKNLDKIYNEYIKRQQQRIAALGTTDDLDVSFLLYDINSEDINERSNTEQVDLAASVPSTLNPNIQKRNITTVVPIKNVNYSNTPNVSVVNIPAITQSGEATQGTIDIRDGINSRWRANFIVKSLGLENIDKITPSTPQVDIGYQINKDKPWGPTWGKCRPPGLHANARMPSKKGGVADPIRRFGHPEYKDDLLSIPEILAPNEDIYLDKIENDGWEKTEEDRDHFYKVCYAVHKIETGLYFGIPQNDFDFRPRQNDIERPLFNHFDDGPFYPEDQTRKRGSLVIDTNYRPEGREPRSVWGAYQYISDVWQEDMELMLPGIFAQHPDWVYPWFAPVKYENAARLWRFKDMWNTIRKMEIGLDGKLHLAQKASVMYMFNHRPVITNLFLSRFSEIVLDNIDRTRDVVELFYLTWEDKLDGKTSWLPREEVDTGRLGYSISRQFLASDDLSIVALPPQFIHKQVV